MGNLTTVRKSSAEVARHFQVRTPPDVALNVPEETLPGYPGMVIREADGERVLESMVWGFLLRLIGMKPDSEPRPVNTIADLSKPTAYARPMKCGCSHERKHLSEHVQMSPWQGSPLKL